MIPRLGRYCTPDSPPIFPFFIYCPNMLFFVLGCLLSAFWTSFLMTAIMRGLAPRFGLIDKPAARKVHTTPTPLGGGVGIVAGVLIPLLSVQALLWWFGNQPPSWIPSDLAPHLPGALSRGGQLASVLIGATVLAIMGLMDDKRPLPWQPRIVVQLLVAILIVMSGVRATVFVEDAWVGGIVSVCWFVVLVNSFNFLDNMDGLSGGIGLIVCLIFATMMLGRPGDPRWLVGGFFLILAGSLIGFLCHNWAPARIFMGDAGSYFVGFTIASMTILGTFYTPDDVGEHTLLAPLCVLAVPLYDITSVIWIRLRENRSPFQPDKRHFSHRLAALGFTRVQAVLIVHLCTLTTGLCGLLLYSVTSWAGAMLALAITACMLVIIAILESAPRQSEAAR